MNQKNIKIDPILKNRCSGAYKYAKRYNMLDVLFPKK